MAKPSTPKPKHIPMRRCVVCRESKAQAELIRFYRTESGWQLDEQGKAGGRGAWLCQKESCHEDKALKRFFRQDAGRIRETLERYKQETKAKSQESRAKRIRVAVGGMNV
ncbi:MAG: DUF448 domain-containing protein [Trueperaceae bacterium]|nr:DUF448 domain-containing protein [Trueperaceae bacterium]